MTGKASDELELVIWGGCHALGGGSSASLEAQVLDACRERRGRGVVEDSKVGSSCVVIYFVGLVGGEATSKEHRETKDK